MFIIKIIAVLIRREFPVNNMKGSTDKVLEMLIRITRESKKYNNLLSLNISCFTFKLIDS